MRELCYLTLLLLPTAALAADMNSYRCLLEPNQVVELASQQPGIIDRLYVDRGDRVKKNEKLVHLRDGVESARLALAKTKLAFALRKIKRNEELAQKNLLSDDERDQMETDAEVARQEVNEYKARLAMRTIRSPVDGVVIKREGAPGAYVGDKPIMTIASIDPLYAEVIAPVEALGKIKVGMKAEITAQQVPGSFNAKVSVVDPVLDATSNTFGVRLILPNPRNRLRAGLNCEVRFLDGQ